MITAVEAGAATTLLPFDFPPPRAGCLLSVVVPARDEEASLSATLAALAGQCDRDGRPLDPSVYEVILLVNNSVDRSAEIARAYARCHPAFALHVIECDLPEHEAHVGRARRLLMDTAAARLGRNGIIATTDADTIVAPDWIAMMLAEFAAGVDAVMGRIVVDRASLAEHDPAARHYHLRDVTYRALVAELEARLAPDPFDPWPRHFQHFGPSIAVTVDAYCRAGGMPPLSSLEDVAFYDALRRVGARIRHAPSVRVTTSARRQGRTGFGFAVQLQLWAEMGARNEPHMVESLPALLVRLGQQPGPVGPDLECAPIETVIRDLRAYLSGVRALQRPASFQNIDPVRLVAAAD